MAEKATTTQGEKRKEPEGEVEDVSKKVKAEPVDLNEKINRQLEYYFSDVNTVKDKFLQEEFKKNDGWVSIATLMTFVRLKQLTQNEESILEALKSYESENFEFNAEKKSLRRKKPIPDAEEFKKELDLKTVHISGFPTDYQFDQIQQFCGQFGQVESLQMRRHFKTKFFKGCIHVVFKNQDDAKKVLEKESFKIKDRELRRESMEDYYKRKTEMAQKKLENRKKGKKTETSKASSVAPAIVSAV